VRVVLDPNVLVSALISPAGPPCEILTAWTQRRFELVASPALLGELRDVLARAKFRRWVSVTTAAEYVDALAEDAVVTDDPTAHPGLSPDPDDDYLITLARANAADYLISGDRHLTGLTDPNPQVLTPRQFRDLLTETPD
jgi:putative PIN family toxin of toxin-antitoxin system